MVIDVGLVKLLAVLFLTLLLAKAIAVIARWWLHRRYLRTRVGVPCKPHWVLGHLVEDDRLARDILIRYARKLPRLQLQLLGPFLSAVTVSHPDTIAETMRTNPSQNELIGKLARVWIGNGLIFSQGERWARDHRLLSKVFTLEMRREYVGAFKDATDIMLDEWNDQVGRSVDMANYLPMLAFDIILRTAMGAETTCQTDTDPNTPARRYEAAVKDISEIIFNRYKQPWFYSDFIFLNSPTGSRFKKLLAETHAFSGGLITERRRVLREAADSRAPLGVPRRRDMLDVLLTVRDEDGVGYSDSDIREHVETFLHAGHDTTSAALEWAILYLSRNPGVQERCRQEVLAVLEEHGGLKHFAHNHLAELPYLTQTIQETLRIAFVAPFVVKTCQKDCQVEGVQFPAGTDFQINII
eukprot:scpid89136/ scgid25517/ Cytochrome P450 4F6; CYPIVF6